MSGAFEVGGWLVKRNRATVRLGRVHSPPTTTGTHTMLYTLRRGLEGAGGNQREHLLLEDAGGGARARRQASWSCIHFPTL